jgi:hypothetical protein
MATALGAYLDRALAVGAVSGHDLDDTLLHAGAYFFAAALAGTANTPPEDPEASIANYCIAADTIRAIQPAPANRGEIEERLARYADFAGRLREPRELGDRDLETARELRDFFRQLSSAGKTQRYEEFGAPRLGYVAVAA